MPREEAPTLPGCPDPDCEGGPLAMWQPFEADPDYVVGICRRCKGVYVLEAEGDGLRADAAGRLEPAGRPAGVGPGRMGA